MTVDAFDNLSPFVVPKSFDASAVLKDFSSALQACRYFWNAITKAIKINGDTPVSILQDMQRSTVRRVLPPRPSISRGHNRLEWNLGTLVKSAGVFWKSPLVLGDFRLLDSLFVSLQQTDKPLMIPHLSEWISRRGRSSETKETQTIRVRGKPYTEEKGGSNDVDPVFLVTLNCFKYSAGLVDIFSVEGVTDYPKIPESGLVCDIKNSTSGCWWLLRDKDEDEDGWFLVKYDEEQGQQSCKLYVGPDGGKHRNLVCEWDGDLL
jgi:hypothetical protein